MMRDGTSFGSTAREEETRAFGDEPKPKTLKVTLSSSGGQGPLLDEF